MINVTNIDERKNGEYYQEGEVNEEYCVQRDCDHTIFTLFIIMFEL